jgi:sulfur carrier protein
MSTDIPILLDGRPHTVPANTTLGAFVAGLGHTADRVTTAVNGLFVPRHQRDTCWLQPGDAVLLFQPIVGG